VCPVVRITLGTVLYCVVRVAAVDALATLALAALTGASVDAV